MNYHTIYASTQEHKLNQEKLASSGKNDEDTIRMIQYFILTTFKDSTEVSRVAQL